jgi:ABC-type Zn uptake system ZnuABC Zn-binding protein ZnuA
MRSIFTVCILLILSNCLIASKPIVVTSASIFHDMIKNIGGDLIESYSIVNIGGDPHTYEATPTDAKLIARANLVLINGLTFEGWINEVIENSGSKAKVIRITEGIKVIESTEHKNAVDPHAWMDVSNGLIYISNIKQALISIAPQHASTFEKNYKTYKAQLEILNDYIVNKVSGIPENQRVLITSHDAFSYFGKKYGIEIQALMGVSTEADAQTSDIERIRQIVASKKIPAIFVESTINPKLLQQIAQDLNISIGGSLYADSIGEEGTEGNSYLGMLKHNIDIIAAGLSKKLDIKKEEKKTSWWMYTFLIVLMMMSWVVLYLKLKH